MATTRKKTKKRKKYSMTRCARKRAYYKGLVTRFRNMNCHKEAGGRFECWDLQVRGGNAKRENPDCFKGM